MQNPRQRVRLDAGFGRTATVKSKARVAAVIGLRADRANDKRGAGDEESPGSAETL
jgi:hypothetical protein